MIRDPNLHPIEAVSSPPHVLEGTTLSREDAGENHMRLVVFSQADGLRTVLFRKPRHGKGNALPDLFDEVELSLQRSKPPGLPFVKEHQVTAKRRELALDHKRFELASRLARLYLDNGRHLLEPESFASLLASALSSLCRGGATQVVYFKTLFVFARQEGLPVKESWLAGLKKADHSRVKRVLENPVPAEGEEEVLPAALIDSLKDWLNGDTELRC